MRYIQIQDDLVTLFGRKPNFFSSFLIFAQHITKLTILSNLKYNRDVDDSKHFVTVPSAAFARFGT